MSDRPLITVAICTFNRARLLEPTLESLTRLRIESADAWELLVVDNASTDDTQAVCRKFQGRLPIRVTEETQPGLSHARNRALASARGAYVVFTDDDVLLYVDWLAAFVAATKAFPDAAAFGGPIEPFFPTPPPPDLTAAFPMLAKGFCAVDHGRGLGPLPSTLPIWGANMAYRMAAVAGLLFDPRLGYTPDMLRGGEETKFLNEIRDRGGEVIWVPEMRLQHYVDPSRMTLDYLVLRAIGAGEEHIRLTGIPGGPKVFRVPRWLLRRAAGAFFQYAAARVLTERVEWMIRLREFSVLRGMTRECRRTGGRAAGSPSAASSLPVSS
jgi:glycosyltransferase involved in cell wall biosynthesis